MNNNIEKLKKFKKEEPNHIYSSFSYKTRVGGKEQINNNQKTNASIYNRTYIRSQKRKEIRTYLTQ